MKISVAFFFLMTFCVFAQGTMFVYDQQSSDESNLGSGLTFIQRIQPTGQSFTPSLDAIGFVRLSLFDHIQDNGTGAVLHVNLRSDSITGPIIDSTAPVALPDNFGLSPFVDFFFGSNVPLVPGTKYYLQPVVDSGDEWGVFVGAFNYSGGDEYSQGNAVTTSDYWFREGVVVPEPSSVVLLLLAGGTLLYLHRRKLS